ncbi:MAG: allantoicase [Elusimicrobiota bacterium]
MRFIELIDLASERLGGKALEANDEFFAPKENLLKSGRGVFIEDKYTSRGKWMDGWETRRRRAPGFDWCVVKLGLRGIIRGVDIDTNHFTGNFPSHASLEARDGAGPWVEVLAKVELKGSTQNLFNVSDTRPWTHVRLNIFPDGGVARLRVHGDAVPDWERLRLKKGSVDLASVENGGLAILASDMFYSHRNNLLMPGRSKNMGDGWETKRRRGPGHDWVIIRLGHAGSIFKAELDTNHFKGNYPDSCLLEGCAVEHGETLESLASATWTTLLPQTKLKAHTRHYFDKELVSKEVFTHIRLNIYPDGGVSRLRLHGQAR